jgi:hypothetical protein
MSEAKPSDIGFGYIADNTATRHVEIQVGPASPGLKSAMKVPGTPARKLENPLSPTFREEQFLEKQEEITEKQQAKDLVRLWLVESLMRACANEITESKGPRTSSQAAPPWCKLWLQSHRPRSRRYHRPRLPGHQESPTTQRSASLG